MSPDTDRTMRLESAGIGLAHAISPAAREELPRPAAVGYTKSTGRTLRQRRLRLIPAPA
jgi:hypothetical protein